MLIAARGGRLGLRPFRGWPGGYEIPLPVLGHRGTHRQPAASSPLVSDLAFVHQLVDEGDRTGQLFGGFLHGHGNDAPRQWHFSPFAGRSTPHAGDEPPVRVAPVTVRWRSDPHDPL